LSSSSTPRRYVSWVLPERFCALSERRNPRAFYASGESSGMLTDMTWHLVRGPVSELVFGYLGPRRGNMGAVTVGGSTDSQN
jgi:hypothetical protein